MAMAGNEADCTSVFVWTVGPEEGQQRCEVGIVVSRWCCSAHTGNEVSSCMGGMAERLALCGQAPPLIFRPSFQSFENIE